MKTPSEMRTEIVTRANEDADFRSRLLGDPGGTIGRELDVAIPGSMSIHVHEDTDTIAHLVLPPSSRLSEGDLRTAVGGTEFGDWSDADSWNPANW